MATVKYALVLVAACGDLQGFGGTGTPVATIDVKVEPGFITQSLADVRVALVWGMQYVPEPLCIAPAENGPAQNVLDAGCRLGGTLPIVPLGNGADPFGFVPLRVEADTTLRPDLTATIELQNAPAADVLVGDLTARVGYASVVVYEDVDQNRTLTIARPNRISSNMMGPPDPTPTNQPDKVLGASFYTMTWPDSRLAYREGAFVPSAFYPRNGCPGPQLGFSYLSADGFDTSNLTTLFADVAAGMLPPEVNSPADCVETALPTDAPIVVGAPPTRGAGVLRELACTERSANSSIRYLEPTADQPDTDNRIAACVHVNQFTQPPSGQIELILTGKPTDACVGINHFILKGCREGPDCGTPDWDHSQAPPTWWPCPLQ